MEKYTNELINESSPYLLQHAHNPVNWQAWNNVTLQKAIEEDKPMLVSIGYSACHWCHVMERESFENTEIADILNAHFICIKVDREERPDVDHVYMNALQMITGQGGWPLNMFTMPDGSPFHGGTYFKPEDFKRLLLVVQSEFAMNREKLSNFAAKLRNGMQGQMEVLNVQETSTLNIQVLKDGVETWKNDFDVTWGGNTRVPKFPVPVSWKYTMDYAAIFDDQPLMEQLHRTLARMARGGIYDQIGGGFARYSTDRFWKIPHFEKMLYDNGQLLELYALGYKMTGKTEYKRVINDTVKWLERELERDEGIWMSALDADSEGEEGRFYIWKEEELNSILKDDYEWVKSYYNINKLGYWENGHYVLMRDASDEVMAEELGISPEVLSDKVEKVNQKLLESRSKRIRPGVDDKCLTSWNALAVLGILEAYRATGDPSYFAKAARCLNFLYEKQVQPSGVVLRCYKSGKSTIPGFLDDYVFLAQAMERMYEITLESIYLERSIEITEALIERFFEPDSKLFYYNSKEDKALIVRPVEMYDNVIPSAFSAACDLLLRLGYRTDREEWKSAAMLNIQKMEALIIRSTESFANWARLYLNLTQQFTEVSVVGGNAVEVMHELQKYFVPFCLFSGSAESSELPILSGKYQHGQTLIYICKGSHCLAPVNNVAEALKLFAYAVNN